MWVVLLNSLYNLIGKVFIFVELELVGLFVRYYGVVVVSDEVYEYLFFSDGFIGGWYVLVVSLLGFGECMFIIFFVGKMFLVIGWKVGWVYGLCELVDVVWVVK